MNLVIVEQRESSVNRVSWEVITAAQQLQGPVKVAVIGSNLDEAVKELIRADVAEVLVIDYPALTVYTSDGYVEALTQLITEEAPEIVMFPHTYQTRDFAPRLSVRLNRALVTDCVGIKSGGQTPVFVRPMFQGKFVADVVPEGPAPYLVSVQSGAYRADMARLGSDKSAVRKSEVQIDANAVRQRPEAPFKEAKQAVDLTQAQRIVAVGRGIKGEEHVAIAQELARALDAELAASRPICDAGWLPIDRQIGSSGQTVAPKLYVALGISGAIQHVVGMKGARTIVAINKDADAPIFEVADYGIVADLFEVVPALVSALGE